MRYIGEWITAMVELNRDLTKRLEKTTRAWDNFMDGGIIYFADNDSSQGNCSLREKHLRSIKASFGELKGLEQDLIDVQSKLTETRQAVSNPYSPAPKQFELSAGNRSTVRG